MKTSWLQRTAQLEALHRLKTERHRPTEPSIPRLAREQIDYEIMLEWDDRSKTLREWWHANRPDEAYPVSWAAEEEDYAERLVVITDAELMGIVRRRRDLSMDELELLATELDSRDKRNRKRSTEEKSTASKAD